jgi:hypothetical protein
MENADRQTERRSVNNAFILYTSCEEGSHTWHVWVSDCYLFLQLDDTALQLYKDGDYGSYLDLEASISEQQEEFDGFQTK